MTKSTYSRISSFVLRALVIVIIAFFIGAAVLSTINGPGEQQRIGLQSAFSDILKKQVAIGRLDEFTVFPNLHMTVAHAKVMEKESNEFVASFEKLTLVFKFFDLFLNRRIIQDFLLEDLNIAAGIAGPQPWAIKHIKIDKVRNPPAVLFNGTYGPTPFDFSAGLEASGTGYKIPDTAKINGTLDMYKITGDMVAGAGQNWQFKNIVIADQSGRILARGEGELKRDEKGMFGSSFTFKSIEGPFTISSTNKKDMMVELLAWLKKVDPIETP